MAEIDLRDHRIVPDKLLNFYIQELLGHEGADKLPQNEVHDVREWVGATRASYELWLSYAMVVLTYPPEGGVEVDQNKSKMIRVTEVQREFRKRADLRLKQQYLDWAVPPERVALWRKHFRGDGITYFISPTHFWFFAHLGGSTPSRPLHPRSLHDIFRHPIYLAADDKLHASLVVPEDFLTASAHPKGSMNGRYYVFPNFAHQLFAYAQEAANQDVGRFSERYPQIKRLWLVNREAFSREMLLLPHPILRRRWRWMELLEMLWGLRRSVERQNCPGWCDIVHTYRLPGDTEAKIRTYLDIFGDMAIEWYRLPRP